MNSFSRSSYEQYLYSLEQTHTEIRSSSVHLYTVSRQAAQVRGSIWFHNGLELRVFELIDLVDGEVLDYSYTVFSRITEFVGMIRNHILKFQS